MYRQIGDVFLYDIFTSYGAYHMILFVSVLLFKLRRNHIGFFSRYIIQSASRYVPKLTPLVEFIVVSLESVIFAEFLNGASFANRPLGSLVGTGANYFAVLIVAPVLWILYSLLILSNPLEQLDIMTILAPIQLFFFKLACFLNGCCWGIPWEHGLYNHHYAHPGKQVPVQLIEMLFALAIFIFLLFYRKKAKSGTVFPVYIIVYSATRFFSEFFTAAYPNTFGPLNTYQIMCLIGIVYGMFHIFFLWFYRDTIKEVFDGLQIKLDAVVAGIAGKKTQADADEKARLEAERLERLEKAKLARAKAKAAKRR